MKKKPILARKKELIELKNLMIRKFREYKLRMADFEGSIKGIDSIISAKVREHFGKKVYRLVLKETESVSKAIKDEVMKDIHNGYFDFINSMAEKQVKYTIEKKVLWKTRTIKASECSVGHIEELYHKGWKIAFHGKLAGDEEVVVFEKPSISGLKKKSPVRSSK